MKVEKVQIEKVSDHFGYGFYLFIDTDGYLGIEVSFLFKENRIYNITVYFSKKYTCDESHINVVYINSIYDINNISKKDHFNIRLGKENKKHFKLMLYTILKQNKDFVDSLKVSINDPNNYCEDMLFILNKLNKETGKGCYENK